MFFEKRKEKDTVMLCWHKVVQLSTCRIRNVIYLAGKAEKRVLLKWNGSNSRAVGCVPGTRAEVYIKTSLSDMSELVVCNLRIKGFSVRLSSRSCWPHLHPSCCYEGAWSHGKRGRGHSTWTLLLFLQHSLCIYSNSFCYLNVRFLVSFNQIHLYFILRNVLISFNQFYVILFLIHFLFIFIKFIYLHLYHIYF